MGTTITADIINSVVVTRAGAALTTGSSYTPGESLTVSYQSGIQFLLRATGGALFEGADSLCAGSPYSRIIDTRIATLVMPSDGGAVNIYGVAGFGYYGPVVASPAFTLFGATTSPSNAPVSPPTRSPLVPGAPTFMPIVPTTAVPSSQAPTFLSTSNTPTYSPNTPVEAIIVEGVINGASANDMSLSTLSTIESLLASQLHVSSNSISVVKRPLSLLQRLRLLSSSVEIIVEITNVAIPARAAVSASVSTYLQSASFLSSLRLLVPAVSNLVVSSSGAAESTALSSFAHTCKINQDLTLGWTVVNPTTIQMRIQMSSADRWFGFGVVQPRLDMIPSSGPVHSVYIYAPGVKIGRYFMTAVDDAGFLEDNRPRAHAGLQQVSSGNGVSYMVMNYSSIQEYPDDVQLDIRGSNFAMWATGPEHRAWDAYHVDRGATQIFWKDGICVEPGGVSPFIIFAVFVPVILSALPFCTRVWPLSLFSTKHIPFFEEYSLGGAAIIVTYLALALAVLVDNAIVLGGGEYYAWDIATGRFALINFWIALIPSSKVCSLSLKHLKCLILFPLATFR